MILAEQIYKVIRQELFNNNITAYSDHIPDETKYPFTMYEITNLDLVPDWAFEKDYEKLTVRFNVYGSKDNPIDAINLAEAIELLFNRKQKSFVDTTGGVHLICSYKVGDTVSHLGEDTYWLATSNYEFECQRDI